MSRVIIYIFLFCICLLESNVLAHSPVDILDSSAYAESTKESDKNKFLGQNIPDFLYLKLSDKDKNLVMRTLNKALEVSPSFLTHKWQNIDNGHKGTIVVMPVFEQQNAKCRHFKAIIYISDEEFQFKGSACRLNDQWCIN